MSFVSALEKTLRNALRRSGEEQGWWHAPGLLAAVSGGSDSMALLHLLDKFYPGQLAVAHLEHGLRGEPSLADAAFVEDYCRRIGVPCFVRCGDVANRRLQGESSEMAGRRVRYAFFAELLERLALPFVATGHTADDVVETMLFHLFRGTGVAGLSGLPAARGAVVRPIIGCRRRDLRDYLAAEGVPWREDETNAADDYQRNKIRNRLLPWVRSNLNASVDTVLLGLAAESGEANRAAEAEARVLLPYLRREHPPALAAWDTALARRLAPPLLAVVIRLQGRLLGLPILDRKKTAELCRLIGASSRWRFQWADDVEVCGARSLIGWIRRGDLQAPPPVTVDIGRADKRRLRWGCWEIDLQGASCAQSPPAARGLWHALIPCAGDWQTLQIGSVGGDWESNPEFRARRAQIPWWAGAGRPVIGWREKDGESGKDCAKHWIPGAIRCMQNEASYVIIARVFAMGRQGGGGGITFDG